MRGTAGGTGPAAGGDTAGSRHRVLILDYSVDRSEAPLFGRWLPEGSETEVSFVYFGDTIPSPAGFTRVMHTGSSLSICDDPDFMQEACEMVRDCVEAGIPQMGVCYGHQLLCKALLGPSAVDRCPGGMEAGWVNVSMKGSGLRIPGSKPVNRVLQSHFDRVVSLPPGSEVIAWNGHTAIQAFADRSRRLLGMQFHPEFDRDEGNRLFSKERKLLADNGIDVESVLKDGPSLETGRVFFGYFMENGWFDDRSRRD